MTRMQMRTTTMELSKNKVLLGLSGGVDSTTAALLLQEKGFSVIGYYFDTEGNNVQGRTEAKHVADQLNIPLIEEDVSQLFCEKVIDNFCNEYVNGRTPNPCIVCNPNVKFYKLIETADRLGAYYIATGHYARIFHDVKTDLYYIQRGENSKKDQSYMLYRLDQKVLRRLIFPLGSVLDKEDTRNLARSKNLLNAEKKDSQEICFVPGDDYAAYIQSKGYISSPGNFVDRDGAVLGKHKGVIHYTMGQRKGLGIALGKPAFVTKIDVEKNQIVLGDNAELFQSEVVSLDNFFTAEHWSRYDGKKVKAKVRYSAQPAEAVLQIADQGERVITHFTEPQRAATPGQSIVFYEEDKVIGGGFIR